MKIKIDVKILLFVLIFYCLNNLSLYLKFIIFMFFHELSHCIIGIFFGYRLRVFEMGPFGFLATFSDSEKFIYKNNFMTNKTEIKDIFVYLAGPLFNFSIALFFYFFEIDDTLVYVNIILGIYNLIPIIPLDGGRILKLIFQIKYGNEKSSILTRKISFCFVVFIFSISSLFIIKFKNYLFLFSVIYLGILYYNESQYIKDSNNS